MRRRSGPLVASFLTLFASLSLSLWGLTGSAGAQENPCEPDGYDIVRILCPAPSTGYIYVCADQDSELPSGVFVGCKLP